MVAHTMSAPLFFIHIAMKRKMKNKKKQWTAQEDELLRQEYNNVLRTDELAKRFHCTVGAVRQHARTLGLHRDRRSSVWPPDRVEQFINLYPNHTKEEIAQALGTTPSAVTAKAFELHLRKDQEWMRSKYMATAFKKGHSPINKGKKWDEYMSAEGQKNCRRTCFGKGHVPANKKPIGYERRTVDGYWEVKVAEPNVFKAKHRILWEQHHGPIPRGTNIVFIDGNPENITIGNLRAETMRQKFDRCCSIHTNMPPEMRQLVQLKGALQRQINRATGVKPKKRRERRENNPLKITETDE